MRPRCRDAFLRPFFPSRRFSGSFVPTSHSVARLRYPQKMLRPAPPLHAPVKTKPHPSRHRRRPRATAYSFLTSVSSSRLAGEKRSALVGCGPARRATCPLIGGKADHSPSPPATTSETEKLAESSSCIVSHRFVVVRSLCVFVSLNPVFSQILIILLKFLKVRENYQVTLRFCQFYYTFVWLQATGRLIALERTKFVNKVSARPTLQQCI